MKVIEDLSLLPSLKFPVVTSGTFDGVHFGHRKILSKVVQEAQYRNGESLVITYWPHPRFVLGKNSSNLKLLSTIEEKIELIQSVGIDYLIKVQFTRDFSELSSEHFIKEYLVEGIQTKKLIIGYDHKFGKDREGSFEYLKMNQQEFGFELEEIPKQEVDHVGVSSTKIRNALNVGDILTANEYLGRRYALCGLVVKGNQVGRDLGFPTANIYVPDDYKLIPSDGVYTVKVKVYGKVWGGMLNIGFRPTLKGVQRTIEANIFNFEGDIYGFEIEVLFVKKIREEIQFDNLDGLKEQLKDDKKQAIKILSYEED